MSLELVGLWAISLANTFGLVLILRQLALRPQPVEGRHGPAIGSVLPEWSLSNVDGRLRTSTDIPQRAALVFARGNCQPCHELLADLREHPIGSAAAPSFLVLDGGPEAARKLAQGLGSTFTDVLVGATPELLHRLGVPATPFGIALRDGKVAASRTTNRARVLVDLVAVAALD